MIPEKSTPPRYDSSAAPAFSRLTHQVMQYALSEVSEFRSRGRSMTCTSRKLLFAISRMRGDLQRYGGTVMFFPDLSQQVR